MNINLKNTRYCPNCSKLLTYNSNHRFKEAVENNKLCQKCAVSIKNKNSKSTSRSKNSQWKGYKDIPFNWFSKYFLRGKGKYKRTGTITIEDVYNIWISQNKKCALTNLDIGFYDDGNNKDKHTCSIDRIDSNKEYNLDNIQLVHKDINLMKNKFNNDYFINICKLITENN